MTVLDKALTEVSEGGEAESISGHVLRAPKFGWTRFVPADRLARVDLLRLIVAKEVRYLRRHPRYRIQVVSQVIVLVLGGAPFISAILNRQPESVLVGCVPALTAGITSSNLFGADGRALWGEVLALPSLKPILQGRSLTFALMGLVSASSSPWAPPSGRVGGGSFLLHSVPPLAWRSPGPPSGRSHPPWRP